MMIRRLLWQEFQTLLVTTLFAGLIWLYAEGENVKTRELNLDVQFVAPPGRALIIEPGAPVSVQVVLRCATGQWTELQALDRRLFKVEVAPPPPISPPISPPTSPAISTPASSSSNTPSPASSTSAIALAGGVSEQTINLLEKLRQDPRFADRGIQIVSIRGDNPRIRIETLVNRSLPVSVLAGNLDLAEPPTVEPTTADIIVPSSLARYLHGVQLQVDLGQLDPKTIPDNLTQEREVSIQPPYSLRLPNVSVNPATAKVRFAIVRRSTTWTVPSIPVWITILPPATERFSVQVDPEHLNVPKIELTGPREMIDRIRQSQVTLRAELVLTADDLESGRKTKPVEFILPAGVTATALPPSVPFKATRLPPISSPPSPSPPSPPSPSSAGNVRP